MSSLDREGRPYDVIVAGAGWGGTAAALTAAGQGLAVLLVERTDLVLGLGLAGGIFRNNGRFTAAEEALALGGGGRLFAVMDACRLHEGVEFPGHRHASLYDVTRVEAAARAALAATGVHLRMETRLVGVETTAAAGGHGVGVLRRVSAFVDERGGRYAAAAFVDATGTAGPVGNCMRHGNGCAMCVMRCPSYGPRVSLVAQAGVREWVAEREPGRFGAMAGSCELLMDSLDDSVRGPIRARGVLVVPLPADMVNQAKLSLKACRQYATEEFAENLIVLDTGHAKIMSPFFPLEALRRLEGFARARFADPAAGGRGNSMRFFAISPRDDTLRVEGLENLFCAGEKCAPQVGHTEAVVTGMLAGHNAAGLVLGRTLVKLPEELAVGDFIAHTGREIRSPGGTMRRFTFAGDEYFARMLKLGLYTTDPAVAHERVAGLGLSGIMG